ncbi:hypothetical protein FKW77_004085 [Venturia effusa]|uniref:BTB domain-containing protein n=1 Tax=Venturia effusa TaxID=50376 RepID=A0A517LNS4_9PEZI|nr:hypothetical protein FKW77_004085 [Venturia effusa]
MAAVHNTRTRGPLQYPDGDVIISLSNKIDLILHSEVLSRYSDFFKAGLSDTWVGNKVYGTKTMDGRVMTMKRYELAIYGKEKSHFLEAKPIPTPSAERYRPQVGFFDTGTIEEAYELAFALMYEDREGLAVQRCERHSCMVHLHEFMDAYQCYPSKVMCGRIEALVGRDYEENRVDKYPFHYLSISRKLHMPRIWMEALRGAALQHYAKIGRSKYTIEEIELSGPDAMRGENREWHMVDVCGAEILGLVRTFAAKIEMHYEPVRAAILSLKLDSILWEKQGVVYYLHNAWDPQIISVANKIFETWQTFAIAQHSQRWRDGPKEHVYWKLFTGQYKISEMVYPYRPIQGWDCGPVRPVLDTVLEKLRDCTAPLYDDLWKSSKEWDDQSRKRVRIVPSRIGLEFDPVPCIRPDLEREFREQEILRNSGTANSH